MENTATVAIVAVAAVALFWFVKRQEAETAMLIGQLQNKPQGQQHTGPYALSFGDTVAVVGTAALTYFGGPGAGAQAANALAPR